MLTAKTSNRTPWARLAFVALTASTTPTFAQTDSEALPAETPAAANAAAPSTGPAEAEPLPPPTPAVAGPLPALPPPPPRVQGADPYASDPYGGGPTSGWPNGITRPFSFALGAGPGFLSASDGSSTESELGSMYAFRVGIGFAPNASLTLGWEGASVRRRDADVKEIARFEQDAFLVGIQYFVTRRLNLRAGFGTASVSEESTSVSALEEDGRAGSLGIGYDLVSQSNFALALELSATAVQYTKHTFTMGGLALTLTFF
jgi:hypothetical protein